jgi:hypothetical protein
MKEISQTEIKFENMSLHTLANLYLDCIKDYSTMAFYENELSVARNILIYVNVRQDGEIFSAIVKKYADIRFG